MPRTRSLTKDPDELIDDTRNFVRNSPGIALAGAAVVGFVVARLIKTGLRPRRRRGLTPTAMLKPADPGPCRPSARSASSSTS